MIRVHPLTLVLLIVTLSTVAIAAKEQQTSPEKNQTQKGTPAESIVINEDHQTAQITDTDQQDLRNDLPEEKAAAEKPTPKVTAQNEAVEEKVFTEKTLNIGQEELFKEGQIPHPEPVKLFNTGELDLDFSNEKLGSLESFTKNTDFSTQSFNSLDEKDEILHSETEIEEEKEKEWEKDNKESLNSWITEELDSNVYPGEEVVMQTFQVYLESAKSFNFRWNPPKSQTLHLKLMNFQILDDGALMMLQNNEKDQYVEVSYRDEGRATYTKLGTVYIQKSFAFNFDTDLKYFRLTNHLNKAVLVIVDLQRLQEVVNIQEAVKNDNFSLAVKKLQVIHDEVVSGEKLREHSYKYQWGFLDNQYSHDSRLLGLTGLELLVMIAAAIIQVYFIKSLLDNRAVV